MTSARFDSQEKLDAAWGGSQGAGAMPVRGAPPLTVAPMATRSSWARVALRVGRNAALGLAILSTIPFGLVANRSALFVPNMSHLVERTAEANQWRDFRAPIDASITPSAAGDALTFGVETHALEHVDVKITSREKTVADCFKYRNKIGLDVALEALREYLRSRRRSVDALMAAAAVSRVQNVIRPYLEALA